jgi:hypothetical protein
MLEIRGASVVPERGIEGDRGKPEESGEGARWDGGRV